MDFIIVCTYVYEYVYEYEYDMYVLCIALSIVHISFKLWNLKLIKTIAIVAL